VDYAEYMERNNNFVDEVSEPINSSQLSYVMNNNQEIQNSRVAELSTNIRPQHVNNEGLSHSNHMDNNVFNIQSNYNINQTRDLDSWDRNFQAISLHRPLEHLVSDMKNIKESLTRMQKYILNKTIKGSEAKNVKDLKGVLKITWGFILFLYKVHWNSLIVDDSNTSFRNMIKSEVSPQVVKTPSNDKGKNIVKLASISSIPPSISAKSLKEVNEISKFFKKKPTIQQKKLYA